MRTHSNHRGPPRASAKLPAEPSLWRAALTVPASHVPMFEALFDDALAVSSFAEGSGQSVRIAALLAAPPDEGALRTALARLCESEGVETPALDIAPVPETDWLAKVREESPPVKAGRYVVHGDHLAPPRRGEIALNVEAGLAFGSGRHASTRGCLLALDRLACRERPANALDLGCGSGILAIAAAKTWRIPVIACDLDPTAVAVARANAAKNGVAKLVRAVRSDGLSARAAIRAAPYALILANILARPLAAMAPAIARHLSPGGRAVLSGLLESQGPWLVAACRAQGLALEARIALDGWTTLIFVKAGR